MAQRLSNLPIGALVKFGKHQVGSESVQPIIWIIADKNHKGYPANSVTLITQKIIDIRAYDAIEKARYEDDYASGGVNYRDSNINMWLNSSAGAGAWYTAVDKYDYPPSNDRITYNTGYQDRPGFLYNFSANERLALLPTTLVVQQSQNISLSVTSKVFIPSLWETIGSHTYEDGSTRLEYFKSSVVTAPLTQQAFTNTASTDKPTSTSVNWNYMTRSTSLDYVHCVSSTGSSIRDVPSAGNKGLRPCINLSPEMKVSDTTDADGCYVISFNTAPILSGSNTSLGTKASAFTHSYTVMDDDADAVTVKEYLDNVEVRSYVATLGASNGFAITGNTWLTLPNGLHTLTIVATDGFDTTTRVITFTKNVNTIIIQRATPLPSNQKPTRIIATVVKTIPLGATFKVYACNNAFDTTPTWEEITSEVTTGFAYVFKNAVTTAGKWGVNIKVTVDRNGTEGACFISEIGGNFE